MPRGGRNRNLRLAVVFAALFAWVDASAAAGNEYPSRTINMIVPFAAGGPTDIVAHLIIDPMSASLGQPITIENVVGAGGTTAATRAMHANPDGYTIIMGHMGTHAAAVALHPALAYNPRTDFAPIGLVLGMPVLLVARRNLPITDFRGFAALARERGGGLRMAHAGAGSVSHVTCSLLNKLLGVKPTMVAFQGTGPAMSALAGGQVDYMCDQIVSVVPQVRDGTVLALAVTTPGRSSALPQVPTTAEVGLPQFQVSAWNALFAPRNTPGAVVERLNRALGHALDDPKTHQRLVELGGTPPEGEERSPEALGDLVGSDIVKWREIDKSGEKVTH